MTTLLNDIQLAGYKRRIKASLGNNYDLIDEGDGFYSIVSEVEGDIDIPGCTAEWLECEISDIELWQLEHGTTRTRFGKG